MSDDNEAKFPRTWQEMSLDYKLLTIFSLCVMFLWMVGQSLLIQWQIAIVGVLLAGVAGVAIYHRVKTRWHWPGVGVRGVLGAVLGSACGLFFLCAAAIRISPLEPKWFPWFAFGGGIILFSVLTSLRFAITAESDYQRCCGVQLLPTPIESDDQTTKPSWKRSLRGAFTLCGAVVWLVAVGYFWKLNVALRDAVPQPAPPKTELLEGHWLQNNKQAVYVTAAEKTTVTLLEQSAIFGLVSFVAIGLALHLLAGVKLDGTSADDDNGGNLDERRK
ncbi:hypothetical protein [Aeoliella sp.]|uniref:hypothetical protein n=1 Tax=Aeoliella sp. TaxID=2795800 RepID=UPI003CCB8711